MNALQKHSIQLLQRLISTESFSENEGGTARHLKDWCDVYSIQYEEIGHTVWATNKHYSPDKPTLLLNSHHDTVRPNKAYTRDPFEATIEDGKLFGLGSNDAGGALVSLLATFTHFYTATDLSHNLLFVGSVEEETAGSKSLRGILKDLPPVDLALVGEPTLLDMAIAEKGLLVFDGTIKGTPSHAAHPNADNPIMKLPEVLAWFSNYTFDRESNVLGPVKMTVTQIEAGSQHNVVPSQVKLVVDVRVNDQYNNAELADLLQKEAPCELTPRSLHLESSAISKTHPLVQAGIALGQKTYGSPTLSDQAALKCPSLKMGPGDSQRSHSADEFIYVAEIEQAIDLYIALLNKFLNT